MERQIRTEERARRIRRIVSYDLTPEEEAREAAELAEQLQAEQESAAAAMARRQVLREYDDEEHARRRPAYVKANGGYDHRDLSLDAE